MKTPTYVRSLFKTLAILIAFIITSGVQVMPSNAQQPGKLTNQLNAYGGPDPWLTYYEGNYYLAATTGSSELTMRKSPTLAGLKVAAPVRIYLETDPSRCCNMWAPEFHLLDGPDGKHWYFYYTAGTAGTLDNQHSHVLESAGLDPMGPYTYKARIFDPTNDGWSIDGSVLQLSDKLYFLFSAWEGEYQSIYIAPMHDPWTINGSRTLISQAMLPWEQSGLNVNEGPVALQHDGKTFIIYSASFCATADYKLGLLTLTGDDPLQASSWVKNPEPVFQRADANGVFAPGHNGFFKSPDGTEDWIVYHANDSASGVCDDRRTTRVQKFTWNADGSPNFGAPISPAQEIDAPSGDTGIDPVMAFAKLPVSRFKSFGWKTAYLQHVDEVAKVGLTGDAIADSQFYVVPGLADPKAVSIQSVNLTGYFLRHKGNAIVFELSDGSSDFNADATWWPKPGLADDTWISFESYNQPDNFIGSKFGVLALIKQTEITTKRAREDATFLEERE